MITTILTIAALLVVAGTANAFIDHLQFHMFHKHPWAQNQFLNPIVSWVNKYKNGLEEDGPAFFGSTTFLVGLTDGWHLAKMIMWACAQLAIAITLVPRLELSLAPWLLYPITYFTVWLVRAGSFHITFHYILTLKNIIAMTRFWKSAASWFRAMFSAWPFWVSVLGMATIFFLVIGIGSIGPAWEWGVSIFLLLCWIGALIYFIRHITRKPPKT